MMEGDEKLLDRLRKSPRDATAWHEFWRAVYPAVTYTAFRWAGSNPDLAKDIAQETFVRFIESNIIAEIESTETAVAYARQIARNVARDVHRRQARWRTQDLEAAELPELSVDLATEDEWFRWDLERLTPGLNSQERELLGLRMLGLDIAEIAGRIGLSYSKTARRVQDLHNLLKKIEKKSAKYRGLGRPSK